MKAAGIIIVSLVLGMFLAIATFGQDVPQLINYQGTLIKDGKPYDGEISIKFSIYADSTGGVQLWYEDHQHVVVKRGYYNVLLGDFPDTLFAGTERYLGIQIGAEPEMRPRIRIASVGYALNADKVDGRDASHFLPAEDLDHLDAADGDPANAVYVDSVGNVGIGTTEPGARLDVNGVVRAKKFEFPDGENAGQLVFSYSPMCGTGDYTDGDWHTLHYIKGVGWIKELFFPNASDLEFWLVPLLSYQVNPSKVKIKISYYHGGDWYDATIYSVELFSYDTNYNSFGPWKWSDMYKTGQITFNFSRVSGTIRVNDAGHFVVKPIYD